MFVWFRLDFACRYKIFIVHMICIIIYDVCMRHKIDIQHVLFGLNHDAK